MRGIKGWGERVTTQLKSIRTEAEYETALAEVERLWGAKSGTPEGDRLDTLATLIDAYETEHYPMDPPKVHGQDSEAKDVDGRDKPSHDEK